MSGMWRFLAVSLTIFATPLQASPLCAQTIVEQEIARDIIHADLPLFGDETEDKWPQAYYTEDEFGCTSRVEFGGWVLRETGDENDSHTEWYATHNYGVFHCFAMVGQADRPESLDGAESRPSFFVLLGTARIETGLVELWALQMGARPGSDYLILSRAPDDGLIRTFNVLQTECPRANARRAHSVDILRTDYCAINSRSDLLRLARRMAQRPARGTFSRVEMGDDRD